MRICVCSLYINDWYREITKYAKIVLEKYCKKHGYDWVYETELTPNKVYDKTRDPPWYKIRLMLKLLATNQYDMVVWNDADSHIVNDNITLEEKVEKYLGDKDILLARDNASILNTGTMFVRNTEFSRKILEETWNNLHEFDPSLHEQASLSDLYTRNILNAQHHIVVLPNVYQNEFLSYWHTYFPEQCFIVHATRCSHDIPGFLFTLDMFCTIKMKEETQQQYEFRLKWLADVKLCREDIESYLQGGLRRNESARYLQHREKQAKLA